MSCTVIAVPYALAWAVVSVAGVAVSAIEKATQNHHLQSSTTECNDVYEIKAEHFIEKDFETPFVDKSILLKTLEEHNVAGITENGDNITCRVDSYTLNFTKQEQDKPYTLRVTCREKDSAEEKVDDLSSEYAMNVQEDAYLHIIDKLKENNMQIEEEEVQDDNTIVLTVNID